MANNKSQEQGKREVRLILHFTILHSPVGNLLILGNDRSIAEIRFPQGQTEHCIDKAWVRGGAVVEACASQLEEYFLGKRQEFDLPVSFRSGTSFQQEVWHALQQIPFGTTVSYSHIANRIGRPKAVRAVGAANGANPISIVIPCHRVIGANGNLTGFGGGLPNKEFLLDLEGASNDHPIRI